MYFIISFDHNILTFTHAIMPSWVLAGLSVIITNNYDLPDNVGAIQSLNTYIANL
jgi:hypothetical protein